jgi:hypothetical protein|tara:strand:- start:106 stop:390 length:285 start_codon:yes stop_codon:yes gene_type:complete
MHITSIHSSYTSLVKRYLAADRKLVETEDAMTAAIDLIQDDAKLYKAETKKEYAINKLIDKCYAIWEQLPKREQVNIDRQYKDHYGYGCQLGSL